MTRTGVALRAGAAMVGAVALVAATSVGASWAITPPVVPRGRRRPIRRRALTSRCVKPGRAR